MMPESAIICQYAMELNKDEGIELIPSDPLIAAQMRMKMDQFLPKYGQIWFNMRKEHTEELLNEFATKVLPDWEQMCVEA